MKIKPPVKPLPNSVDMIEALDTLRGFLRSQKDKTTPPDILFVRAKSLMDDYGIRY